MGLYSIFIGLFAFFMTNFLSSKFLEFFVHLEIRPLSDVGLVMIFFHYVGCHFVLLTMSFDLQSFSVSGGPIY